MFYLLIKSFMGNRRLKSLAVLHVGAKKILKFAKLKMSEIQKRSSLYKRQKGKESMTNTKLNWHLFDGEGGEGGNTSSGSGQTGLGAEADAFLASLGGEDEADNGEPTNTSNVAQEEASEGSDTDNSDSEENQEVSLEDEFAELVGKTGRFHELYGKAVSDAIQQRFKNQADMKAAVDSYDSVLAPLFQHYGVESGDIEGLSNALGSDDDWIEDAAKEKGMSPDQYRENLRLQSELEKNQKELEEYRAEAARAEKFKAWNAEADELRGTFPNFDLTKEMEVNPKFADLIDNGISVLDAFVATHAQNILQGINAETSRQAKQDVVNQIQQRQSRPMENGLRHQPAVVRKQNPSEFTDEDIDKILKDVEGGKKFTF